MIYKNEYLLKRKKIYKNISKITLKNKIHNFNDLFFYQDILYKNKIKYLTKLYIKENFSIFYKKNFDFDFFKNESDLINKLPNITPNGIINPRKETQDIYKLILDYIFRSIEIINPYIKSCAIPAIRYRSGISTKRLNDRPYATSKIHSDAWVGQFGDAIISLGVIGDFKNNGVKFYYPEKISLNFFKKIDNYDCGKKLYINKKEVGKLNANKWYLFDHAILHKSFINNNSKPRISIDFGVNLSNNFSINSKYNKRWRYLKIKDYQNIDKCSFLNFKKSIYSTTF